MAARTALLTDRLLGSVTTINGVDATKFSMLLTEISKRLSRRRNIFDNVEKEKLSSSLELEESEIDILVEAIVHLTRQAACHVIKPQSFHQQLLQLKFDEEKADAIAQCWATNAKSIVEQLRHNHIAPKELEDLSWSLHLQMGSKSQTKQKIPKAIFQFGLSVDDKKENVNVEFDKEQLYDFYKKLEEIQSQIDGLL